MTVALLVEWAVKFVVAAFVVAVYLTWKKTREK